MYRLDNGEGPLPVAQPHADRRIIEPLEQADKVHSLGGSLEAFRDDARPRSLASESGKQGQRVLALHLLKLQGEWECPVVVRIAVGGYIKGGPWHSANVESFFAHIPGWYVV